MPLTEAEVRTRPRMNKSLHKMKLLQIGSSWFSYQFSGLERYYAALVMHLPALGMEMIELVYELNKPPKVEGLQLVSFGTERKCLPRKFLDQRRIVKTYLNPDFHFEHIMRTSWSPPTSLFMWGRTR